MRIRALLAGLLILAPLTGMAAAQQPTSRPIDGREGRQGGAANFERVGTALLERSRTALNDLNLTEDQKTRIDAIFKKARTDFDGMRKDLESMQPRERVGQLQEFFKSLYQDIGAELTDAQRSQMQKTLEQLRPNRDRGGFAGGRATTGPSREQAFNERPVTAPAADNGAARLERLRDNLTRLDLTDDQKARIRAMLDDIRDRAQSLREQAKNGSVDAQEKLRGLSGQVREKLMDLLTPEQLDKLHDITAADGAAPTSAPAMREPAMREPAMNDSKMSDPAMRETSPRSSKTPPDKVAPAAAVSAAAQVGDAAPAMALKRIDGSQFQLASLRGRVVVLEFGSWTSPAFRERAAVMEKLKNEYGLRAQFFVIYEREAHAKGEWEVDRNKDKDILVDQPTTLDARMDLAKKARQELKITVPILVDSIGNEMATAYGAGENSAVVINRDGVIVARQNWFDPGGLHHAIDDAVKALPATKPAAAPAAAK